MVNYRDPAVIAQDSLVIIKLFHTLSGLYIWEFFTSFEYEWNVIRGRRPYRWTIWIYVVARMAPLFSIVAGLTMMDTTRPINCQAGMTTNVLLSFLTFSASSLLIVVRVIAIWNTNRTVAAIAIGIWGINVAFLIQCAARIRSTWSPAQLNCVPGNVDISVLYLVPSLVTDITLLLIMLVGLFRLRRHGAGTFGLTQLLWRQGLIWLLIATIIEVPPVVLVILNLNGPFNVMFQPPAWITMAIAATRMHRSLVDFASGPTDIFIALDAPQNADPPVAKTQRVPPRSLPFDRMMEVVPEPDSEVAVRVVTEQYLAPDCINSESDEEVREKPKGLFDNDVERGS